MDPHAGKLVLNGAPSQLTRLLPSPDAARARVDGRTPAELRAFAVQMAGLVKFYDLEDQVEGDWSAFFLSDPGMLAASLASAAPDAAARAAAEVARRVREEGDPGRKRALLRELFAHTHALARQADAWMEAVGRLPRGGASRRAERRLSAAVAHELAPALRRLRAWDAGAGARDALGAEVGLDYAGFGSAWGAEGAAADSSPFRGGSEAERIDAAVPALLALFGTAAEALSALRDAGDGLDEATPDGMQAPQSALFDAFAGLFGTAQATLDTLPARYADFYFRQVLREPERGPVPDQVYLAFALEPELAGPVRVQAGTEFPAGEDADGHTLLYAAERSLAVTAATLERIRMLRAVRGPLIVSITPPPLPPPDPPARAAAVVSSIAPAWMPARLPEPVAPVVVQQVLASHMEGKEEGEEATGEELADGGGWPTFGPGTVGTVGALVTAPATLGFAVATPELLLTGGRRCVAVGFRFTPGPALVERLDAVAAATGLSRWEVLRVVLEAALLLSVSTSDGWFPLEGYRAAVEPPAVEGAEGMFSLGFELPSSVPAVVPLYAGVDELPPEAEAAPNPAPALPTLAAWLRPGTVVVAGSDGSTAEVYPLAFLDQAAVSEVEVRAWVRGLADLVVSNTDGVVDASAPFPVLGGSPAVGSYLELRSAELFSKVPTELSVTLRWLGLPPNTDGFKGWYRDYTIGLDGTPQPDLFDNATFRGAWSVVKPGAWQLSTPTPGGEPLPYEPVWLFRTRPDPSAPEPRPDCATPEPRPAAELCPESTFARMPVARTTRIPAYYQPADSALRLELREPPYGFGSDLYAVNVLNAVIEDLPDAASCQACCLAGCQPLKDAADGLTACVRQCQERTPPDPTPCIDCVGDVEDALAAAASACLAARLPTREQRARARAAASLPPDQRVAALRRLAAEACPPPAGTTPVSSTGSTGTSTGETTPAGNATSAASTGPAGSHVRAAPGPVSASGGCGCVLPCERMIEGVAAIQAMLEAGGSNGPTPEAVATCALLLSQGYVMALQLCMDDCMTPGSELRYPNEPYLPTAEWVTVDYRAGGRITPGVEEDRGAVYHLLPFGGWMPLAAPGSPDTSLLSVPADAGSLLLGFEELAEAQTLSLLFQMETRGDDAPSPIPPEVAWSRLSGNQWQRLPAGAVPLDGTHGLRNSGIVALQLPEDRAEPGTRLPGTRHWLRAAVADRAGGFPWTVSLRPHALAATWVDTGEGAGAHLAEPLPAGTITTSVQELPGIGTIVQPMPSFGGRPPETNDSYQARLGERLRHKERAVQAWDYERLVLERFPQLWMARALPARDGAGASPGATLVVVVAGKEGNESADTTVPHASGALLAAIGDFLAERATPFARIQVVNPVYVRVQVDAVVAFRAGPEGGDVDRLNDDLVGWLSPWFYDAERAARQGSYAFEPDISEFIQTRPYVESLFSLSLAHDPPPEALEWYFLTSADGHLIREDFSPEEP